MGRLVLVRHGQANFLGRDYDRLSALGAEQARALGAHWLLERRRFDRVYSGSLRRQVGTAAIVGETYRAAGAPWPEPAVLPGLDEFPAEALLRLAPRMPRESAIGALYARYRDAVGDADRRHTLSRLLEAVTASWIGGAGEAGALPTWEAFRDGVRATLAQIIGGDGSGHDVAAFTSSGVIGACLHTVQGTSAAEAAASIWRLRNCSLTQLTFGAAGLALESVDAIPHLSRAELVTDR